ncbi:SUKH-4 family immunity protein [Glycomyces xiaoerkulensis]|uniref:SUKH-4 family immunity protein n=1 Tax=Glycomyces xiaoerkulensis TaxID=2038139 RepID=UPI000C25D587|nr:SUKH-4 family immunity protein [Glycomyces xiaoerkulensis]
MSDFPAPASSYPDVDFIPIRMSVVYTSYLTGKFELYADINLETGAEGTMKLVVIGAVPADPEATLFCFDTRSGRIFMLGVEKGTLEVVNSSFKALTKFLYHFALFLDEDTGAAGRPQRAAALRSRLEQIDPAAFADPESWWSVAFMQLEGRAK